MDYGHYTKSPVDDRDSKQHLEAEAKRDLEKEIVLSDSSHGTSSRLDAKTRVLRASDVLLSLAGGSTTDIQESSPGLENFQEALRLFPPFRDDDGITLGAVEVKCPDCDAVFSTPDELKQHYLTRFCSGGAVAVYVMMRDRLITKGYRMEKRLISFDSRPVRFFCSNCERQFSFGEEGETMDRLRDSISFVDCKHCGSKCNISYEPILNDPRDDMSFRDIHKEIARTTHSRSPSLAQKSSVASKFPSTDTNGEQSLARKARRLRDSWSFRKLSQGDEDELLAISFAGLYDLERVHAPHGIYQQLAAGVGSQMGQTDASFCSNAHNEISIIEPERPEKALCEDENQLHRNNLIDSKGELLGESGNRETPSRLSKRQSFLQKIFGKKAPKGVSRAQTPSNKGNKLLKRVNTVRFSFIAKYSRSDSRATARDSPGTSQEALAYELPDQSQNDSSATVQDAEYMALLRGTQNIYVHMQYLSGGAVVHDASGRQRILQMDEVAKLFLQLKDETSAAAIWSRSLSSIMRAETALKQGNSRAAVVEFHNAMRMLDDTPALDLDKQSRAAILHSLGQAYRNLDRSVESEACYLEALGLYKRTLGRDHPKNFAVLNDLGSLCGKDGYATEAAAFYERSFAGRLKTLGNNAPETLSSMQDLASLKVLLGDLESALLLLEKAVPALDTVFGIQNATTLNAMNQLSLLYEKLGLDEKSRTICGRTIPHCRIVFGVNSAVTRETVVRYLDCSDNFDLPPDIKDILDYYQRSPDPDSLRVIHRLGRSYMTAGLNRDAANLFESLVEEFLAVKGPEAHETFDALSALCVSREHLDSIDKAILAYKQLVHMAGRTPEGHHSRKRIAYAEKRISELNRRRELLATERKEWDLNEPGQCENCGGSTTALCNTCKLFRFCSESCHKLGSQSHLPYCIPSVSLRESKSLAVKPKCPSSARDQALSKISRCDGLKSITVMASYTFYLDPRNFTTFRMKLNPQVNTVILFSLDSDIQYATITNPPVTTGPAPSKNTRNPNSSTTITAASSTSTSSSSLSKSDGVKWLTPERQEAICYMPNPSPNTSSRKTSSPRDERYVLVTPGKEMLRSIIEKRVNVRGGGGQKERFRALDLPDSELIEYAQGLLLTGYLGEAFMYVIEWAWK